MQNLLQRKEIGNTIAFNWIEDKKFKHNRISVNFILPLQEETATQYAVLPFLMQRSYRDCPDASELAKRLDTLYGASISGSVYKVGDYQIITLTVIGIDDRYTLNGEELTAQCAEMLAGVVCRPNIVDGAFPKQELDLERQSLQDTIEAEVNDKRAYASTRCVEEMFAGKPCAVPRYGRVEYLEALTPESCAEAYERMLRTAAIEIIMVGASANEGVAQVFADAFAGVARDPIQVEQDERPNPDIQPREVVETMALSQAKMVLGFTTDAVTTDAAQAASRLMAAIYGATPFSKLFLNVREKLSLCYYCAARTNTTNQYLLVECGVEDKNKQAAQDEILHQLAAVQQGDFTEEELYNAQLAIINSLRSTGDSLGALERWYLAQIIQDSHQTLQQEIESIRAVDRDAVMAFAKTLKLHTVYLLTGNAEQEHE